MFYIVETEDQLERLKEYGEYGCFVHIITSNDFYHPALSGLVGVYIRPLYDDPIINVASGEITGYVGQGYIIPVCHDEGINVSKEVVEDLLKNFKTIHVINGKNILYQFPKLKTVDLSLKFAMSHYDKLDWEVKSSTYDWFYNRYGDKESLNQLIPISQIYDRCEKIYNKVKDIILESEPDGFEFYNVEAIRDYFLVEQAGIQIDSSNFIKIFTPNNEDFSIYRSKVYTNYNMYNVTGRPTNSFNAVNFLAIPKGEDYRKCFRPSTNNGEFIEYDYDGYHIRLVSEQIGYKLKEDEKAHLQLAKLWTGKDTFTDDEYGKLKGLNFQIIYGSIPEEHKNHEFSRKVQSYIDNLYRTFVEQGRIRDIISHKAFTQELRDMYPQKLMNYMIQSLETSRNVVILKKVLKFLNRGHYKSKIILITYDSFLMDYNPEDGEELVNQIKNIMEGRDKKDTIHYPVKIHRSKNLNF